MSEQRALMHEQAKAAVWPRLSLMVSKSHSLEDKSIIDFKVGLTNAGVGPAIIKHVKVLFKGQSVANWWALFDLFGLPEDVPRYISNSSINQSIIRQGESIRALSLEHNLRLAQEFYENAEDISFEIYYESIYGDQWKYSTGLMGSEETTKEMTSPIVEFSIEEAFQN